MKAETVVILTHELLGKISPFICDKTDLYCLSCRFSPYDFHRNGTFSHCGVDAFSLLKTTDGWKSTGTMYTFERTGCEDHPLGPLEK